MQAVRSCDKHMQVKFPALFAQLLWKVWSEQMGEHLQSVFKYYRDKYVIVGFVCIYAQVSG